MRRKGPIKQNKNIKIPKEKLTEYKEIFNMLDTSKTGEISINYFIKLRQIFCYPINEENMNDIINKIDIDGKGKLDFKKFIELIQKQIEYVNKTNELTLLKSYKEELNNKFLGNKRKRGQTSSDNIINFSKEKNLFDSDFVDFVDELYNRKDFQVEESDLGTSFSSDGFFNKNKIMENGNTLYNEKLKQSEPKSTEEDKGNNIKTINKTNIKNNKIIKLISKNKQKKRKNLFKIIKFPNEEKMNNKTNNLINIPSNIESDFNKVQINSVNNTEESFLSFESNIDYVNTFKNRAKENTIQALNNKKDINNKLFTSENLNTKNEEKLSINKISSNQDNKFSQKNICNNIILNSYNPSSDNNNKLQSDYSFEADVNNTLDLDELFKGNSFNNIFSFGFNEINEERNNNENSEKCKIKKKYKSKKIQILSRFELLYRRNKRKEKIIKKVTEIPYSIIIDKNVLNLEEISQFSPEIINISEDSDSDSDCYIVPNVRKKRNFKEKDNNDINLNLSYDLGYNSIRLNDDRKKSPKKSEKERNSEKPKKRGRKPKSKETGKYHKRNKKKMCGDINNYEIFDYFSNKMAKLNPRKKKFKKLSIYN